MTKLVIGQTPKTFKPFDVDFVLPDGEEDSINVTYVYRSRSGFAKFLNELYDLSGEEKPADGENLDFEKLFAKGGEKTVAHLLKIIDSWRYPADLTKETLFAIYDQAPAAAAALTKAYSDACTEGKLGNLKARHP